MAENGEQRGEQCVRTEKELPIAFGNFTNQENWDFFYAARGAGNFSEWYADWPQLRILLRNHLSLPPPEELSILVPACGNSRLSEHLYDDGFRNITNVDFSREVISAMLKRNLRERPGMRWRVMDITDMQFASGTVDAIIDKGGLDALMEPNIDPRLGTIYLSEAKRLLKAGGKYICLTAAQSHVLGLLFRKFRFGWKVNLYAVAQEPSSGTTKQRAFMFVAEKYILTVQELFEALERENTVRAEYSNGTDTWHSLNDLNQGVQGNIGVLEPGRAVKLFLGETGVSRFFYSGLLLDGRPLPIPFSDQYGVLFVHSMQTFHGLLTSSPRQWALAVCHKAARLLIVVLDANHNVLAKDIESDIFRFIKQLAPGDNIEEDKIVITYADEGYKQKKNLYKVTSTLTGPIAIDDVIYFDPPGDIPTPGKSKDSIFRRLRFGRNEAFARSEALLSTQVENKKVPAASRTLKKGKPRMFESQPSDSQASSGDTKVDHKYLSSGLYKGLLSGLLLFSIHSKRTISAGRLVKTVIIGLGAGLLPMSLRNYVPTLKIEVVELDPVVLNVAKEYFSFEEDDSLKVHITDAMKFVKERAEGINSSKIDVLIIDVDSSDSSSGLISPEAELVEEPFLLAAKDSLSDKGLFILKLATGYPGVRTAAHSKLQTVFSSNLFSMPVDEGFSELIFALKKDSPVIGEEELAEACEALRRSLEHNSGDWIKQTLVVSKKIAPLRKS
ncbi:hypothetical protein MIMGU_mgv1a025971mg [Erythranthe guttata]|uniref:Methyltransferase type 11 domain-containing protein n=1 Tax=Erythranthe guttata TaxID=4155 RepID=A0A022QVG0_ERYGU|nr:hypothetical protein MIMGU_mgv1a025971mg [Erythranthe guttata]